MSDDLLPHVDGSGRGLDDGTCVHCGTSGSLEGWECPARLRAALAEAREWADRWRLSASALLAALPVDPGDWPIEDGAGAVATLRWWVDQGCDPDMWGDYESDSIVGMLVAAGERTGGLRSSAVCTGCRSRAPTVDEDGLCRACGGEVIVGTVGDIEAVEELIERCDGLSATRADLTAEIHRLRDKLAEARAVLSAERRTTARLRHERSRLQDEVVALRGDLSHLWVPLERPLTERRAWRCRGCGRTTETPTRTYYDPCPGPDGRAGEVADVG